LDTLEGMGLLVEVVEAGSFSAAGRRLALAPSSVARGIGTLEEDLGTRLLNRTTRKLSLTESGRLFHERARRILTEVEDARLSVSALEALPRGTLRLNVPVAFGRLHIAPMVPAFLEAFPEMAIDLVMTDAFSDLVEEGIDLAVRIGELSDSTLIARRLGPNRRVILASPAYAERAGMPRARADLASHNCLIYKREASRATWNLRDPSGEVHHVQVQGSFTSNNADALHAAALGGLGLALLPTWLVGEDIAAGRLQVALGDPGVSPTALDTHIYAVYPQNRRLSPKVRAFVDALARHFGRTPYWEVSAGLTQAPATSAAG
jgi:DNA-binding transcriptional LysR family regulator